MILIEKNQNGKKKSSHLKNYFQDYQKRKKNKEKQRNYNGISAKVNC